LIVTLRVICYDGVVVLKPQVCRMSHFLPSHEADLALAESQARVAVLEAHAMGDRDLVEQRTAELERARLARLQDCQSDGGFCSDFSRNWLFLSDSDRNARVRMAISHGRLDRLD
jgi:hypothetical protein